MLRPGLAVPHVDLSVPGGGAVRYADIWQRRPSLLVCTRSVDDARQFSDALRCTSTLTDELISWLEFVQTRCPECEGEVR